RTRVAVRGTSRAEVVALDGSGEALADRRAVHVDLLAGGEHLGLQLRARRQLAERIGGGEELADDRTGFDTGLREVPGLCLRYAAGAARAVRDLDGAVPVVPDGLDLGDAVAGHVEHRHRDGVALTGEDAHHADLAPHKAKAHCSLRSRLRLAR